MDKLFLKPRLSEKTYQSSQNQVYVFTVNKSINRSEIKTNIEKIVILNMEFWSQLSEERPGT